MEILFYIFIAACLLKLSLSQIEILSPANVQSRFKSIKNFDISKLI